MTERLRGLVQGVQVLVPAPVIVRLLRVSDRQAMLADPVLVEWLPSFTAAAQRWQSSVEGSVSRTEPVPSAAPGPGSEWVTVAEAAVLLDVGPRRVLALIHDGKLPGVRRGRWWIRRSEVALHIENRRARG